MLGLAKSQALESASEGIPELGYRPQPEDDEEERGLATGFTKLNCLLPQLFGSIVSANLTIAISRGDIAMYLSPKKGAAPPARSARQTPIACFTRSRVKGRS